MKPKVSPKVLYPDLSYEIMAAVYEVHNQLGPGFTENIYETALVQELKTRGIACERQKTVRITYKGKPIGTYRLDLLVEQKIILEIKAVSALTDAFKAQLVAYLKATNLRLGILINFGTPKVTYQRIVN
jgi:GxxExxY protein